MEEIHFFTIIHSKNMLFLILLFMVILISGNSSRAYQDEQIPYNVPLDEIAEKLEYIYIYENMIYDVSLREYQELGMLPSGKDIQLTIYAAEGNKILFLPKEKSNTTIILDGEFCNMYYSKKNKGYIFFLLRDWAAEEDYVPVNSLESDYYCRFQNCIVKSCAGYRRTDNNSNIDHYSERFYLEDIKKLGEINVTFDPQKRIKLPAISIEDNEYIDALITHIKEILRENQKYGNFTVYLETFGRLQYHYGGSTSAKITGVVKGEGIEQYFCAEVIDRNNIDNKAFSIFHPYLFNSPTYFVDEYYLESKPSDWIDRVIGFGRGMFSIKVNKETEQESEAKIMEQQGNSADIDFRNMKPEEAANFIEYICSYSDWFGMNELGYQVGQLRKINHKRIVMYTESEVKKTLYFIPMEKVNHMITSKGGDRYPVYQNNDGEIEFYSIDWNDDAIKVGQLKTSLVHHEKTLLCYIPNWIKIGEAWLDIPKLNNVCVEKISRDENISALETYIKEQLMQNGKSGKYELYIGEYEASGRNKVCLSAAVVGEEIYYVRYLIVKSQLGKYYFWDIGFGLDGSLSECHIERHLMNQLCAERTMELNRCKLIINI